MGYASAMAVVLFVVALAVTAVLLAGLAALGLPAGGALMTALHRRHRARRGRGPSRGSASAAPAGSSVLTVIAERSILIALAHHVPGAAGVRRC